MVVHPTHRPSLVAMHTTTKDQRESTQSRKRRAALQRLCLCASTRGDGVHQAKTMADAFELSLSFSFYCFCFLRIACWSKMYRSAKVLSSHLM